MMTRPRKLLALLTRRERGQLAGLSVAVLLMGLTQAMGVGSIAPFISVLVAPESARTNDWLRFAFDGLSFSSVDVFLVFLASVAFVAVILSIGFMTLTQWMFIRFGEGLRYRLSRRLLESYLANPYITSVESNSADTGKNILSEANRLGDLVLDLLRTVALSVAGLFILSFLLLASPAMTLAVIGVLGGGYGITYLAVRKILSRVGERRMQAETARFKAVNEAFGGLKETKVLGREAAMVNQYAVPARRLLRAQVTEQLLTQMPRNALEILAAGMILMMAVFLTVGSDRTFQGIAPVLAMYAFGTLRLLPFLGQIYVGASQFRTNAVVVDTLYDDMIANEWSAYPDPSAKATGARLPFRDELRLENVTFQYPRAHGAAVEDVTLVIPHQAFVAIVGATGAGKTTLVDIILGLLQPEQGFLSVDSAVLDDTVIRAWQNNLGYVPQDIYLTDDSIAANIAFGVPPENRENEAIEKAARIANIHDFVDALPKGYETIVGERGVRLSGGQRQRIGIARALYHDPEVLILDEATSDLDQSTEKAVHEAIEQVAAAKTVIMIAHRLVTTRHCDKLYLMDRGRLVAQGSYETLLGSNERFQAMAG